MKNIILYFAFTVSVVSSNLLASELIGAGTTDDPRQISCSNCYTDLDFKNTAKSDHQAKFEDYIDWVNSGAEKNDINLDYPSTGPIGATGYPNYIANSIPLALQQWVQANSNLGLFTFRGIRNVTVTFQNGDVATFAVTRYASATNFPLLLVVDENDNIVALVGAAATISHG